MRERLLGVETEYGFKVHGRDGRPLPPEAAVDRLMRIARERLVYLPDGLPSRSIFLPSGRLYIDSGMHPEFSTVEVTHPSEAVRYLLAGERILSGLTEALKESADISEVLLFKCNVDYCNTSATWGCHESYLYNARCDGLTQHIIPHLVSRIIYTGAGGFDPQSPGCHFTLSPRVAHLSKVTSSESTRSRGIYHTKNEALCKGSYRRLHLICGDSVCSHVAAWLKVATTGLVVAMVEGGLKPGESVQLADPLAAMRTFAKDTRCKAMVESTDGKGLTALGIQRHYLERVEAHMYDSFMPSWAEEACRRWRMILDRLENAPDSVNTILDWAIKLTLYRDHVRRQCELEPSCLTSWKDRNGCRERTSQRINVPNRIPSPVSLANHDKARRIPVSQTNRPDREKDAQKRRYRISKSLRAELFEIDVRFGQLGEEGIFTKMDRGGVLNHRLSCVEDIETAVNNPPATGRAHVRGTCIQRLADRREVCYCNWDRIIDFEERRELDLTDPFVNQERWHDMPAEMLNPHDEIAMLCHHVGPDLNALRALMQRTRASRQIRRGDRVRIVQGRNAETNHYIGQTATVVAVSMPSGDARESRFTLDIDNAQGYWHSRHVRLLERAFSERERRANNRG